MIGQTISHYRILEQLGAGGMGVVYKAFDTKLDRPVALKFLPPHLTNNPEARERFIQEAKAASALQHGSICVVYDIDTADDGRMFISMEYVEGETLKKRIERGPLDVSGSVDTALKISEGLARAHEHGIVHRDIKSDNIMITPDGQVKIMDFGLAKVKGTSNLTTMGTRLGTAAYMSPEQARGEAADQRTDIWSLGVVLYEMLTGGLPFRGEYENALFYSLLNTEPRPLTETCPGVPLKLAQVVEKCLAKRPEERYQCMSDLIQDLRSSSAGSSHAGIAEEGSAPAAQGRGHKRPAWYVIVVPGVVVLAVIAFFLARPHREEGRSVAHLKMIAVLPFENLGSAEDEYFADGLTDEITSRLSAVGDLGVISRTSAMQYKKTQKTLPVIAKELGVDYVLEGTVRWDKSGSVQKIRITPQLIQASAGDVHLWAENMDRTIDDIFSVQTEIATRVVNSLGIVLEEGEKGALGAIPTRNLDAYQVYLRGLSFTRRYEQANTKSAITMFRQAVALDSTFALAYAQLANAHLNYYWFGYDRTKERLAEAKQAIDKAFSLSPALPEARVALGHYYYFGFRDYTQALEALELAKGKLPNNSQVLKDIGFIWRRQAKFDEAVRELKEAFTLDPKAADLAAEIAGSLVQLGRYAEAESYCDRSISLQPDQYFAYFIKANMQLLWHGDTRTSRSILEQVPTQYYPWQNFLQLDIYDRNWSAALEVLPKFPEVYIGQDAVTPRTQLRGVIYRYMGDTARASLCFDSARVYLEGEVTRRPDDERLHMSLGIVYAGLGRKEEAVREGELATKLLPLSKDALLGCLPQMNLAEVYIMVGKSDAAIDQIQMLLSLRAPKWITVPLLRIDPACDPLRNSPRFQALLAKGG